VYATFLHDVVYLYAVIVDEMIQLGLDYRNGTDVMHRAKNFQFNGNSSRQQGQGRLLPLNVGRHLCHLVGRLQPCPAA